MVSSENTLSITILDSSARDLIGYSTSWIFLFYSEFYFPVKCCWGELFLHVTVISLFDQSVILFGKKFYEVSYSGAIFHVCLQDIQQVILPVRCLSPTK